MLCFRLECVTCRNNECLSFPGAPEDSNRPLEVGGRGLILELATKSELWILPVERPASDGCQIGEDTQISHVFWPGLNV